MTCLDSCYPAVKKAIASLFSRYGEFVGRHPLWFIILPIVIFGGLGAGIFFLEFETDVETVYYPMNSQAMKDRQVVRDTFPDLNNESYNAFSLSENIQSVSILFKSSSSQNIFDPATVAEINTIISDVKNISTSQHSYIDVCAKFASTCVVIGEFAVSPGFQAALAAGNVTYPLWNGQSLDFAISGTTVQQGKLVSATVVQISFHLAFKAEEWMEEALQHLHGVKFTNGVMAYQTTESLGEEVDNSTRGDIIFFVLTVVLCCIYACVVSAGGNPVSTRGTLALGGILATLLGIVGAVGLLSAVGVKFVNIAGVIPFLIIGIGVDDMFLMMSAWSEHLPSDVVEQNGEHVPRMMGRALAAAGVGITITSLTDVVAFAIGTASVFRSVITFCLYAGLSVLFCYLANLTLFSGWMVIHGRRVFSWRHSVTCHVTRPKATLKEEGRSSCFANVCGGSPPEGPRKDESVCERFPHKLLPHLIQNRLVSVGIIIGFLGYLAVAIYGAVNLKEGLLLQFLVNDDSYYRTYLDLNDEHFPRKIPVGFIVNEVLDYGGSGGTTYLALLQRASEHSSMDDNFERCWLTSYKTSSFYNATAPQDFISNLSTFLASVPEYESDVVFDSSRTNIIASRCFLLSQPTTDQYVAADMMVMMRELASESTLSVFPYNSSFVAFEQLLIVLPTTLLLVGCAVAVMGVITFIFLPHILMVSLVMLNVVMILTGIFGFMHFWDLTLSSITMTELVMSVGFSVDFSAHMCSAYLMSNSWVRQARAKDAIRHAGGPVLNGGMSTLIGVLLLIASKSYVFQSFFKVMFLVIVFGILHAVLFLPAVLSLVGPESEPPPDYPMDEEKEASPVPHRNGALRTHSNHVSTIQSPQPRTSGHVGRGASRIRVSPVHNPTGVSYRNPAYRQDDITYT